MQAMPVQVLSINAAAASWDIFCRIMKRKLPVLLAWAIGLGVLRCHTLLAQETKAASARAGVYDSRAVAYAWFWSAAHQRELTALMQQARAAQTGGDTNRFQTLKRQIQQHQAEMHREVFSTAPATTAFAALADKIPAIEKQAGVAFLVSKWDAATNTNSNGAAVDVTDRLIREFIQPTEKQLKIISSLEQSRPLPLDQCDELIRQGKI
jgi:hypothetical protein